MWIHVLVGEGGRPPRIASYGGRSELRHWLRAVATRRGIGVRRREPPAASPLEDLAPIATEEDLELVYWKKLHRTAFEGAFAQAFAELRDDDRLLLKQRFRHAVGFEQLARVHGVSTSTAFRRVEAARLRLIEATRTLLQRGSHLTSAEASSMLRFVPSQVELRLSSAELPRDSSAGDASPEEAAVK